MKHILRTVVTLTGIVMLLLGVVDRNYQVLAIAGSILIASIVISGKPAQ